MIGLCQEAKSSPVALGRAGSAVLARLSDPRVEQYWDKHHLFAEQLRRTINAYTAQPNPSCCTHKGIRWDEVSVYHHDAHWDGQPPRAVYLNGPVLHSLDFSEVLTSLLSK